MLLNMNTVLLITLSGVDRPGLVQALSETVAEHEANWEQSRMLHLSGHFVGLLEVVVPEAQAHALITALRELGDLELTIAEGKSAHRPPERAVDLQVLGADHPGIVSEVFGAIAKAGLNVETLTTETETAPDSGQALFRAKASVSAEQRIDLDELRSKLEAIAADIVVEIDLKG